MKQLLSEDILGYPIAKSGLHRCLEQILKWLDSSGGAKYFVCANPHSVVKAESDEVFKRAITTADLVTPDGIGIVAASRILGGEIRHRVTGSDIFQGVNDLLNERGGSRVFLMGSREEVLAKIQNRMSVEYPNIESVGTYSPPFKSRFSMEDNKRMMEAVNAFGPDVLWVGMTAPKQEKWIYKNRDQLDVKFIGAVGAVFDFYAETKKRSSGPWIKVGLEWLHRLLREPGRLWERSFKSGPMFLGWVLKERLSISSRPGG